MADITCPACGHEHDAGDYPDHRERDTLECEGCGRRITITAIDWDPTYYTTIDKETTTDANH